MRDTGFGGGSGELRKGGCSHKAEEELQVTSADSSATGQRRPARGHASTCPRGDPTSSGRDSERSASLASTSSHRRAVLWPTGPGPGGCPPQAGGWRFIPAGRRHGDNVSQGFTEELELPFPRDCWFCFFFLLVGGWSGGLLVSRCSQKAAINQSGVCTNSHTRPAEGGAEGPGGGAAPPGGAGPGGPGRAGE